MAKITKNDLKDIVKECLVEILAEGLIGERTTQAVSSKKSSQLMERVNKAPQANSGGKNFKKPSYLDNISFNDKQHSQEKMKKIADTAKSISKDPILSEMLADTAQTTLQEQFAAESQSGYVPKGAGDGAQKIVSRNNHEDIFGSEAAG